MVDLTKIPPLDYQFPIVDPNTGCPSPQFMLLWQQMFGNTEVIGDTGFVGGTGIDVTGSLGGTVTIAADLQESLNAISSTQGAILYRNASSWVALPPGTTGQFLKTNGAAANPAWASVTTDIQTLLDGISTTQGVIIYYNGTDWVALSPGTSGQYLKTNGAGANPAWASVSGGGSSGTLWAPPAASAFTLISGDATNPILTDDTDVGLMFDLNTPVAGDKYRGAYKALPSPVTADWTCIIGFRANFPVLNFTGFGMFIQDSGSGRIIAHRLAVSNTTPYAAIDVAKFNSTTSYNSNYLSASLTGFPGVIYLRMRQLSNTYYFDYSADGKSWVNYYSSPSTNFLTTAANRIGFGNLLNSATSYTRQMGSIIYWYQSW